MYRRSSSVQLKQLAWCKWVIRIVVSKVGSATSGAADGQQSVFVTTGEPAREPWRIMTADPAIDGH